MSPPELSPVVTVVRSETAAEGIVGGPLSLSQGCLYVDDVGAGNGVAVFWHGTLWEPDRAAVVNADGTSVTVGEAVVAVGGGYQIEELAPMLSGDGFRAVQQCGEAADTTAAYLIGLLSPQS